MARGGVERNGRCRLGHVCGLSTRNSCVGISSPTVRLPLCSRLSTCAGMYPRASRDAVAASDTSLAAGLSPPSPFAMESSAHTPAGSDRSTSGFLATTFLHSAHCSLRLPGSMCVRFPFWLLSAPLSHTAWDAAEPLGNLCHVCESLHPPCCCLGAPPTLLSTICVLNPRLPLCGGWSPALLWI